MTWLQPWAAWFLAGIPAIVLLYMLRLRKRPLSVSTLMFWQRVLQASGRSALFQKLRHVLSLLLQILIFALLIAALARPTLTGLTSTGTSTVLILDTRARMQANEPDGLTRFEKARRLARDYIRQASRGREFALLTVAPQPSVAVPFTEDEKPLAKALDQIAPTDAGGDIASAIALADSLLAGRDGSRRIILLSDQAAPIAASPWREIITHGVGSSLANIAITRFSTRPLPGNPQTSEVFLETQNFSREPVRTEVELAFDGRTLEVKPLALAAGERRIDVFTSVPRPARSARGWLTAKLSTSDAQPLDNIAYATLPPPRASRVLLVSRGNPFLEKLLSVDPGVKYQFVKPEGYDPAMAVKFEVVIFDDFVPAGFDLKTANGNFLFLKASPFAVAGEPIPQPPITEVDTSHSATRVANLQNVSVLAAQPLQLPSPHDRWTFRAPLRSLEHPLLVTGERSNQRVAALAFSVLESDLPLRVAFPLLFESITQWLAGDRVEALPAISAGEIFPIPANASVASSPQTRIHTPNSAAPNAELKGFFQPLSNGFYSLRENDTTRWLAVNTFNPAESDLQISATDEKSSHGPPAPVATFRGWPLWQVLALTAFTLLLLEWWMFHRRATE